MLFLWIPLNLLFCPLQLSHSSNNYLIILGEIILRHRQIQGRRPLPRSSRDVVVRAVAGAEPTSEVAGLAYGDAAKMRTYAC